MVYLDIPNYIYMLTGERPAALPKYIYYTFFVLVAPLLLQFRALTLYLISPFSLWAFALIMLNIAHLLDALIDGDQHG